MPPAGALGAAGSRIPAPRASAEAPKPGIGSGLYVADGPGLELVAPKVPTTFEVRNTSGAAIKAADLRVSVKGSASVKHEVRERKDGGLEVSYAAPMSGEYRISVSIGPTPVPGSPFRVSCQQPRPCEKLSKADWGLGVAFVGERYVASVTVADQFGNLWTAETKLTANVLEGSTVLYPAEVRPGQREGAYEVSFKPEISGVYGLAVSLEGGRALKGSPFPVRAKTDETVAANCKIYGGGLTRAVAGQETSFTIQAVDGKNNARLMGGDTFDIEISGPGNAAPKAEVTDNNDGTYTVQWSTEKAGDFLITAWLEECEVGGCAKACSVQPAELCAERSSCEGPGLSQAQAGEPTCFKVTTRDRFGNLQTAGGDDVSVQVASAAGDNRALVTGSVSDMGRGSYKAAYMVTTAGQHEIRVLAGGKPVAGSPFALDVTPGQIRAGSCKLTGPGMHSVQLGREMRLAVHLADSFGNAIADPGALDAHNVQVTIDGPAETAVRRGPLEQGGYSFAYSTKTPGTYTISATAAGGHMDGSPATVTASIAEAHAPLCEVVGTPLRISTVAGEEADVAFVAKDAKGFQKSLGGDVFTVSWARAGDDEPPTFGKVVDLGTGEYMAKFTAPSAGAYQVSIQHKGGNIAGCPFPAEVLHSSIAADCSYVVQEGLEKAVSGQQATFRVRAMDRFLNLAKLPAADVDAAGPKGFQALLLGPGRTEQAVELVPNRASSGGCELTGSYVPRSSGMHHLAVVYRGEHIKGSPWQVTVACAAACARKSQLSGIPQHFIAGREERIMVAARDSFGGATEGGDDVCLVLDHATDGSRKLVIEDCRDGTYKAVVRMDKAGLASIHAQINGQPLGLPATLHVLPAELHSLLLVTAPAVDSTAGEQAMVVVSGRDRFLNAIHQGGASLVATMRMFSAAEPAGTPKEATMEAHDRGNGSYSVDCSLKQACDFEVSVHLAGYPETTVTCHGKCRAAQTCPALCQVPEQPAALAAGQSSSLTTWRFDRFGNRITSAAREVPFLASGSGPGPLRAQIVEKGDGSLEIRYSADKAGQYKLAVKSSRDGEPLAGSPFSLTVIPGELSPSHCTADLAHGGGCLTAGAEAAVCVRAKDHYGNTVHNLEGHDVKVSAQGPEVVSFQKAQSAEATHCVRLQTAGMYLVHVTVNGHPLSGWPKTLHVTASASEAARCMLSGPCLASQICIGRPQELALHTYDSFGNARAAGGEEVAMEVLGPQGTQIRKAAVTDRGNGCYGVSFQPDREGRWLLTPRINGKAVKEEGFETHAVFGHAAAQDCAVLGSDQAAYCGSASELSLVPAGPLADHRAFLGSEKVHAHVRGTSGAASRVAASLAEDRKSWRVPLPWFESGKHHVSLYVDGAQVGSGAVAICARPNAVSLAASHFEGPGLSQCIAGERAEFIIQARDAQGHAVTRSEAPFAVRVSCGNEEVAGDVVEEGEGVSWVTYTLETAGAVTIEAILPGEPGMRSFRAVCAPAVMSLAHSAVASAPDTTVAGETCSLTIKQHDRFGNPSDTQLSDLDLSICAEGPSSVEHSWHHDDDHSLCLQLASAVAGSYSIDILDHKSQDRLPGGPIPLAVAPGAPVAWQSAAKFGKSLSKEGILVAGAPLEVKVAVKDVHGNLWPGEAELDVSAEGPEQVPFEKTAVREFAAPLRLAGTYVAHASLGGISLTGWPRQVTVVASREGCSGCAISGSALTGVFCDQSFQLCLTVTDCFSNSRTSGGDKVEAFLTGPGDAVLPVAVKDLGNGCYTLSSTATRPGAWTIKPRVNGEAIETAQRQLSATYGPVTAADCLLSLPSNSDLECGAFQKLIVQPRNLQHGCKMTGHETVIVTMLTPKGVSLVQALTFNQAGGVYGADITSLEVGQHTLKATVNHEEICNSPLSLCVVPGALRLSASVLDESALTSATAGQTCTAHLSARNAFGARVSGGGAPLTAAFGSDGNWHAAEVADNKDGTYDISLKPEKAGSFQLVLSMEGLPSAPAHKRTYSGMCAADVAAAEKCAISGVMTQLVAGQPGKLTLTRADRFGNPVLSSKGQAPFVLMSSGPGALKHTLREAGSGSAELEICATIVGTYNLSVSCGSDEGVVPGSQVSVQVNAAPASHAHCMAEMKKPLKGGILEAGKHAELAVTVFDQFGNVTADLAGHSVEATAHGPATVPFVEAAAGVYRAELKQAGSYAVRVGTQGHMLPGWPQALHVQPCAADASKCWLSGAALQGVTCGQLATVVLHTVDCFGNPRVSGGEEVAAQLHGGPSRGIPSTVKANLTDNCDGTYALQFSLALAGDWALSASVGGQEVPWPEAAQLRAEYAPLAAQDCEISGVDGLVSCGTSDPIFIQAMGGRTLTGYEAFSATVKAPDGSLSAVPVTLAEGGAHYQATLQWLQTGIHKVTVYLDGHPIPSTPFGVKVGPAGLHAPACAVRGLTETCPFGMLEFEVHGRDAFGNSLQLLPRMLEVFAEPKDCLSDIAMAQWEEASVITVRGTVKSQGLLRVLVDGKHVLPGGHKLALDVPEHSTLAFMAPDAQCRAGEPHTALVQLLDCKGFQLQAGGAAVSSSIAAQAGMQEAAEVPVQVRDRGTGLYELQFTLAQAGEYLLSAWSKDASTSCAETQVTCKPGKTSPLHCRSDMSALTNWQAGQAGKLSIIRKDRHRNLVTDTEGEPPLGVSITGPGPAHAELADSADCLTEVLCTARTAGDYVLSVFDLASGALLFGSPFKVNLTPGALTASSSWFRVTGSTEDADPCMCAGQDVEIALAARDGYGNAISDLEADAVKAIATGNETCIRFEPYEASNSGKQHYLRAVFSKAGSYALGVTVTDPVTKEAVPIPVHSACEQLIILPGTLAAERTQISDPPATLTAGASHDIIVTPYDSYGNAGASGGRFAAELASEEEESAPAIPCQVTESTTGGRSSIVSIRATAAGQYRLRVLLYPQSSLHKENPLPECVAESQIRVVEAGASSAHSWLGSFWPPQGAVAGISAGLVIQACDEYGNKRRQGGDAFKASIRGLDADAASIADRGDGTYALRYCLPSEGAFSLCVTGPDGTHLRGSPATLTAFRDVTALAEAELQRKLSASMVDLRKGLSSARGLHASLRAEAAALESFIPVIVEGAKSGMQQALAKQDLVLAESKAALAREAAARRKLHNLVQELRGNIRVFVRVKPADARAKGAPVLACEDGQRIACIAAGATKAFEFDRVFGPESTQEQVFNDVAQLVTSALDGYNVCIFAYGQTGAGKTYTMEGTQDNPGINYRTMKELFRCIENERADDATYDINASIVELYNEQVWDLLAPGGKQELELAKSIGGFDIPDLTQIGVTSPEQILGIMAKGFEHRATGCHDINAHSSRSHCLLVIHAAATDPTTGVRSVGKLTLCDLAGSERINKTGATGLTLTEAQNINRSLLELGNVISALMQQSPHVPYRNSKLTMLLQDSLGGNAKALMIANLAPSPAHATETLSSLAFASKVANVVLKTPQRKLEDSSEASASKPGGAAVAGRAAADAKRSAAGAAPRAKPPPSAVAERAASKSRAFQ